MITITKTVEVEFDLELEDLDEDQRRKLMDGALGEWDALELLGRAYEHYTRGDREQLDRQLRELFYLVLGRIA